MNIDIAFSRKLLSEVHKNVKAAHPNMNLRKAAWVYGYERDHWEFHGPNGFYWHGSASNAYEARAIGWEKWLGNPNGKH